MHDGYPCKGKAEHLYSALHGLRPL